MLDNDIPIRVSTIDHQYKVEQIKLKSTELVDYFIDTWIPTVMIDPDIPVSEKVKLFDMLVDIAKPQKQPMVVRLFKMLFKKGNK